MGDDLDAVALGLKRGRRGAVTVVVLLVLALAGFLVVPARGDEVAPAMPAATSPAGDVTPPPPPATSKRSRATRGVARTSPAATPKESARKETAPLREKPLDEVVTPPGDEAPTARPSIAAEEVVSAGAQAVVALPSGSTTGAAPAAEVASPPPAPPAEEEEEVRDGNGEAIARAIAAAKRVAVRDCFERELKQTPTLQGTVVVELDLAPPNKVSDVRVSDDLERPAFTRCVVETMRDVRFAALDEDVSVRVPYALTPGRK